MGIHAIHGKSDQYGYQATIEIMILSVTGNAPSILDSKHNLVGVV